MSPQTRAAGRGPRGRGNPPCRGSPSCRAPQAAGPPPAQLPASPCSPGLCPGPCAELRAGLHRFLYGVSHGLLEPQCPPVKPSQQQPPPCGVKPTPRSCCHGPTRPRTAPAFLLRDPCPSSSSSLPKRKGARVLFIEDIFLNKENFLKLFFFFSFLVSFLPPGPTRGNPCRWISCQAGNAVQENEENVFLSETSDRSSVQECRRWVDVGRFSPASAKAAGLQPPPPHPGAGG